MKLLGQKLSKKKTKHHNNKTGRAEIYTEINIKDADLIRLLFWIFIVIYLQRPKTFNSMKGEKKCVTDV